jgi:hypothetical protein
MDSRDKEILLSVIQLIVEVGGPAAIKGIKQFTTSDNPTPEEIRALSNKLQDPAYYWEQRDVRKNKF